MTVVQTALQTDADRYAEWALSDPVDWSRKILGDEPTQLEAEMMEAIRDHRQVAIRGCHASGKTYRCGRLALWWVCTGAGSSYGAGPKGTTSVAILTGPTFRQVQQNAWAELERAYQRARGVIGGKLLPGTCRLAMGPRWGVLSFATDKPVNLSGFHGRRVLVMVDEASGVEERLFLSLEGLRASGTVSLLLTSQGTQTAGTFFRAFHDEARFWHTIQISAFRTPNFQPDALREWLGRDVLPPTTDQEQRALEHGFDAKALALQEAWEAAGKPDTGHWRNEHLVNPAWACQLADRRGLDDDEFAIRVLGGFGKGDPNALISLHLFDRARSLLLPPSADPKTWMGLDVAERGDDDSTAVVRRGPHALHYEERHGWDPVQVAGWAAGIARRFGVTDINFDATGVGAGVGPVLRPQLPGVRVHDVMPGSSADDKEQFANRRAEMYWALRERFEGGELSLVAMPRAALERLSPELTGVRWKRTPAGKILIEPKDDFKRRLGRSPDAADGLAYAFAKPTGVLAVIWAGEDDDPFSDFDDD